MSSSAGRAWSEKLPKKRENSSREEALAWAQCCSPPSAVARLRDLALLRWRARPSCRRPRACYAPATALGMGLATVDSATARLAGQACSAESLRWATARTIAVGTAPATTGPCSASASPTSWAQPATPLCLAARTSALMPGTVLTARATASPGASVPTVPSCSWPQPRAPTTAARASEARVSPACAIASHQPLVRRAPSRPTLRSARTIARRTAPATRRRVFAPAAPTTRAKCASCSSHR